MAQGIYKISFKKGDKYFPIPFYIGVSKNIEKRLDTHKREIKSFYNIFLKNTASPKTEKEKHIFFLLNNYELSSKFAIYEKICSFMFLNDYVLSDVKYEILKELNNLEMENIHYKVEQQFIKENDFAAERCGFNGPNARAFTISSYLERHSQDISKKQALEFYRQLDEIESNYQTWKNKEHSIIIDWNLKDHMKWEQYINELKEKLSQINFGDTNSIRRAG